MKEELKLAIKEMADGKENGFNKVYTATYQHVYFRAKELMKEEQDALDLVQNVYVEAYKGIKSLQSCDALFGWLDGIIYRQGMKIFRKKKDVLLTEEEDGMFDSLETNDITGIPELSAEQKETAEIIKSLLDELPELQKMALISYYYDGHSVSEIAKMQECSEGTVKSRLNYARKALKDKVEEKEKKDGCRLHVFALPTLWFAIKLLSDETTMSETAAQGVYNASCKAVGLKATTIKAVKEGTELMKKAGLKMKWASLGMGGKIAVVAATVFVVGGITVGAVSAATQKDNTNEVTPVAATEIAEPATEETIPVEETTEVVAETPASEEPNTEAPVTETTAVETPAPTETTMWATTSVNVRAEASKDSNKVGTLAQGDTVTVIGDINAEWVGVTLADGTTGFIKGSLLSATEVAKPQPAKKTNTASTKPATNNSTSAQNGTNNSASTQNSTPASQPASAPAEQSNPQPASQPAAEQPAAQPASNPEPAQQPAAPAQQPASNPAPDANATPIPPDDVLDSSNEGSGTSDNNCTNIPAGQ